MTPLELELDYPFDSVLPVHGDAEPVAPGLLWVRMPLPFALDHINLWLLDEGSEEGSEAGSGTMPGWTVIDCGIANEATRAAWESLFATRLNDHPIVRVLATHCHPDHVGLAGWLCSRWGASLWMSAAEYGFARMMSASLPGVDGTATLPHFERNGLVDPALLEQLRERKSYYPSLVPAVPIAYHRLQEGQIVQIGKYAWRVITGLGHSPEHVSLYCAERKLLISGDMVLPRISTNVSVFAVEPEANPLADYLNSLDKFNDLPAETLVLPSHGMPFRGLHTRIMQLRYHHQMRLAEVISACAVPRSAAEILPFMFHRKLDAHQLTFALGEVLAHLHKLWFGGVLRRYSGEDGILRFVIS